jgi:hypothetical protein
MLITGGRPVMSNMQLKRKPAVQCMSRIKRPDDSTIHKHDSECIYETEH